ncbi:MAG: hypothetical protein V4530_11475 [Pseudomonadota bacterium]
MANVTVRDYYVSRVAAERYKTGRAIDPAVAAVHRALADEYDARIAAIDDPSGNTPFAIIPRAGSSKGKSKA